MRRRLASAVSASWLVVGLLGAAGAAQFEFSGPHITMDDMEVQSRHDASSNETEVMLALRPEGPYGVALLLFFASHDGQTATSNPEAIGVFGYLHTVNPTQMRHPVLAFAITLDDGETARIDLSDRLELPGTTAGELLDGFAVMTLVEFSRLMRAPEVTAHLFGLDFPLRADQREALWTFAEQVLPGAPP